MNIRNGVNQLFSFNLILAFEYYIVRRSMVALDVRTFPAILSHCGYGLKNHKHIIAEKHEFISEKYTAIVKHCINDL